jgi:hypothetical protein
MKKIIKSKKFNRNEECFLLPRVTPDIYISYNLAIVGNSSRLSRGKYGIEIDNHKNIIRFNYAPTNNYENQCGKKNNIRLCSYIALTCKKPINHPKIDNTVYNLDEILKNNKLIIFYKKKFQLKEIEENKTRFLKNGNKIYKILWDKIYFNDVLEFYKIKVIDKDPQCGTGMMLLLIDLNLLPDIYGLDKKYCDDNYYYYWDNLNKKCKELSKFHNYENEFRIPNTLSKMNLINYH